LIKVVVTDAGADLLTTATAAAGVVDVDDDNNGHDGGDDNTMTTPVGQQVTVFLAGLGSTPIAGDNTTIQVLSGTTDLIANGTLSIVARFDGSVGNDPWIRVQRNTGTGTITISNIVYKTSSIDQIIAGDGGIRVKSDLETTGVTIQADETGLSTGRFVGYVRVVSSGQTTHASTGAGSANAGAIRASVGPITLSFTDSDGTVRQTTVSLDTSAPTANVTGPVDGSATQNRRPTFSGSVSDNGSGLLINSITVAYDNSDDDTNLTAVVNTATGALSGNAVALGISVSGAVNGDLAFSFSQAPSVDIPNITSGGVDNVVDWVVKASDLAGNIGLSDADPSTTGIQIYTVKIDQTIPTFATTGAITGKALSGTGEVDSRKSIRVVFTDQVQNVQASDFVVTLTSGATIVPTSVAVDNNPTAFPGKGVVYLTFLNDLASNATPRVDLQDTIQDLAGNSTASGTLATVPDGIKPSLTVTYLGGSGTGTGSEGPAELTNDKMTIRVTSDEPLTSAPSVMVYPTTATSTEATPTALSQGTNTWDATYTKPGSAVAGEKAVVVTGTDVAANSTTVGDSDTTSFTLDFALASPVVKVGGSGTETSQVRPFITIDFADSSLSSPEASTVSISEILLDDTDVTADLVASSNGKKFFITPSSDLAQGEHEVKIATEMAVDAAGNKNVSDIVKTFTVNERVAFERNDVFAGWNGVSFPSDPVDPAIDSVFTNAGHDAVLGWDPSVPGGWRIASRDAVSGEFTTTAQNGLTTITSKMAYWVHSNNFEPIEVLLTGETLPGNGTPPPIVSIPTVSGFNAVPIIDSSRRLTSGASGNLTRKDALGVEQPVTVGDYLGSVNHGRVVVWDPETLSFLEQDDSQVVNTGTVLFAEVIPDSGGKTPAIFP
jgi:hypothetical protein